MSPVKAASAALLYLPVLHIALILKSGTVGYAEYASSTYLWILMCLQAVNKRISLSLSLSLSIPTIRVAGNYFKVDYTSR